MIVAGIDPGREGGLAFLDTDTGEGWGDLADTTDGTALRELLEANRPSIVAIEVPTGRPPKHGGYTQIAQQWRAIGVAEGVVTALGIPLVRIAPKDWQAAAFAGRAKPRAYGERKKLALRLARERWPMASLSRVKDSGLADALWVALMAAGHAAGKDTA